MPRTLLSLGTIVSILQNVVYALPAKRVWVKSDDAVEVSIDGSNFDALTNANTVGAETSAPFLRCPGGNTTVIVKGM